MNPVLKDLMIAFWLFVASALYWAATGPSVTAFVYARF
jgi:hypothetical protein